MLYRQCLSNQMLGRAYFIARSTMHKISIKYQILIALVLWCIWVIVILTNTSMLSEIQILYNLKNRGVQKEAEVIQAASRGQELMYTYQIDGKIFNGGGEKVTMKGEGVGPSVGSKINITYDVEHPNISKYGPIGDNYQSELFALIIILIIAPLVIIVTIIIRQKIYLHKRSLTTLKRNKSREKSTPEAK